MCNKVGYDSKQAAKADAKALLMANRNRTHGKSGKSLSVGKLTPYECFCGEWHLTAASKSEQKRIMGRINHEH